MITRNIHIKGIVQGVGFRPFIYKIANEHEIKGWVNNSSAGVEIAATGTAQNLDRFLAKITEDAPPLARIDRCTWEDNEATPFTSFEIKESAVIPGEFIPISPDMAICDDCAYELFQETDHRFRYPFINCTNCGPRLTIIKDIPYDRPKTTMQSFPMCDFCQTEYEDPENRRFHAQPVACPTCGPSIWFQSSTGNKMMGEEGLKIARNYIKQGKIIAIKGLGGFHLACDAHNPEAVSQLRARKKRSEKPFALMAFDIDRIEKYCQISPRERDLILSREKPIVIVFKKTIAPLPTELAPGRNTIGIMLPYTPLHLLLLEPASGYPELLVMTSGNISEEPIDFKNELAVEHMQQIADGFLLHNRDIHIRVDDSVVAEFHDSPYFFRRARGFAPIPINVSGLSNEILAVGAELKNTFCLSRHNYAFVSHHIGDLKNHETYQAFTESIAHYQNLFNIQPQIISCDLHPEYLSTKYARKLASYDQLEIIPIQHHHAHLASCLADNEEMDNDPVIGVIFDGTGFGTDGNIWGGEILIGNTKGFSREFHLENMPLPGGDKAVENPDRIAAAYLYKLGLGMDPALPPLTSLQSDQLQILKQQIKHNINVPLTSSMGRLFDAVASLSGLRHYITYEAQAAIELEQLADHNIADFYQFELQDNIIGIKHLLKSIIADIQNNMPISTISAKFHNSIVNLVVNICENLRKEKNIDTVALSGGVWQNLIILDQTVSQLQKRNFKVLFHHNVPANDGGVSLGQLVIAQAIARG